MTSLINSIDMTLSFNDKNVRVLGTPDKPMFIVKDICNILGITNTTNALRSIPDKWHHLLSVNGTIYFL